MIMGWVLGVGHHKDKYLSPRYNLGPKTKDLSKSRKSKPWGMSLKKNSYLAKGYSPYEGLRMGFKTIDVDLNFV